MEIQMQGRKYLVIHKLGESRELAWYLCRRIGEAGNRRSRRAGESEISQSRRAEKSGVSQSRRAEESGTHPRQISERGEDHQFRAVQIPSAWIRPELVEYLMDQVHNENFREFVDYATEADHLTFLMDCGFGRSLWDILHEERPSLPERFAMAEGILRHMLLSDYPAYFIYAAMDARRIKRTDAMDFYFDFELSDFLTFQRVDFVLAGRKLAEVLELLFARERNMQALPELETLLYQLRQGGFDSLLPVYQELQKVFSLWSGKEETELADHSLPFRIWDWIKGLGRWTASLFKLAVLALAMAYLVISVRDFIKPEAAGPGFEQIGDLKIGQGEEENS